MKKTKKTILALAAIVVSCFAAAGLGCGSSAELELKTYNYAYLPEVYLNREFDAISVLEKTEDGVKYGLSEAFYLDNTLERIEIPFSGTKFTHSEPYNVYITIYGEKGGKKAECELVLKYAIETSEIQSKFIDSWNDTGVTKVMTADKKYMYQDEKSEVMVSYNGYSNPIEGDGVNIGGPDKAEGYSVTDWSNAVLTMRVYNSADYDLSIGGMFLLDGKLFGGMSRHHSPQTLVSHEWTTVRWSFKSIGIDYDIFGENVNFGVSFKVRIPDTAGLVSPYSYSFIISGLDITDYSEEKFPGLDTTKPKTDKEIFDELSGDSIDKCLVLYYTASQYGANGYPYRYFFTTLVSEIDETTFDESIEGSTSSVKYTVNASEGGKSQYFSAPICLSDIGAEGRLNDYITGKNFEKGILSFRIKNAANQDLIIKWTFEKGTELSILSPFVGEKTIPNDGAWHTVEIEIDAFNAEKLLNGDGELNICSRYKTAETDATFYIDGLDIIGEADEESGSNDVKIERLLLKKIGLSGDDNYPYRYHFGALTNEISKTEYYGESKSSIKYVMTQKPDVAPSNFGAIPLSLNKNVLDEIATMSGCADLTGSYVGFWVRNGFSKDLTIRIYCQGDVSIIDTAVKEVIVKNDGEWHYVETALSLDMINAIEKGVLLSVSAVYMTSNLGDGATFYIDDFKIYKKS